MCSMSTCGGDDSRILLLNKKMLKETIFRNKTTVAKQFKQKTPSRIHTELIEHEKEVVEILF